MTPQIPSKSPKKRRFEWLRRPETCTWLVESPQNGVIGPKKGGYLEVEGEVTRLGLLQVALGVLEPHLEAVGLGLDLAQLGLLPLRLHLLLGGGKKEEKGGEGGS